jgi:Na+/H+ antiporter NhaC|tara:strand:- start:133 stop:357 length:225 start_codon:yes stop_codon:yes gene_type:complete
MNVKSIVSSVTDGADSLVGVVTSLIVLSVFVAILTGSSAFGTDIVGNVTALIQSFLDGGFAGLLALLVLASFWK